LVSPNVTRCASGQESNCVHLDFLAGEKSHNDSSFEMKDDLRTAMENMLSSLTQEGMMREEGKRINQGSRVSGEEEKVALNVVWS
jgi:hypothetical protein